MTAAPGEEDPEAPRHCREDMVLVGEGPRGRVKGCSSEDLRCSTVGPTGAGRAAGGRVSAAGLSTGLSTSLWGTTGL